MNPRILTVLCALALLAACGKQEAPPAAVAPAPTFALQSLADVTNYPERSAPAAVVGKNEARLSAEVAATILALPVDVGQSVNKGAVVARLDPRDAELALERAAAALAQSQARHAQAKAQFDRARTLRDKSFYSAESLTLRETELAAAAADLRAANAQHETVRRALAKHTLRAPFTSVVRARSGQVGELAAPGTVLLTLVDAQAVELAVQLQPRDAEALSAAAGTVTPELTFVTGEARHPVKLLRVSPTLNRESRSVEARLLFVGPPPAAGTEGRLLWRDVRAHLPAELLVRREGRYGVFVAEAGKAHFHVLPQAQEGRPAALDLPPATQIVTQGRHALQEGMALK